MKVKITASCIWNVAKEDTEIALDLIEGKAPTEEVILDYLQDALKGDEELTDFEVSVKEL